MSGASNGGTELLADALQDWRYKAGLEQGATDERKRVEDALRALYHAAIDPAPKVVISMLCDQYLDRSGALLGRVREPL